MSVNTHGIVYSGVWTSEGHSLTFLINENDTVTVTDSYSAQNKTTSSTHIMPLDDAIELQQKYIKFGYDKVS